MCAARTASCCQRGSSGSCSNAKESVRMSEQAAAQRRPEIFHELAPLERGFEVTARPPTLWARLYANGALRKGVLLVGLAVLWELYARALDNPLLFPTFSATVSALFKGLASGAIARAGAYTLSLLLEGYVVGL